LWHQPRWIQWFCIQRNGHQTHRNVAVSNWRRMFYETMFVS
jgi:hypothetical protein